MFFGKQIHNFFFFIGISFAQTQLISFTKFVDGYDLCIAIIHLQIGYTWEWKFTK
jgi:hypothetical protein